MSQQDNADNMDRYRKHFRDTSSHIAGNCPPAEKLTSYADNELAEGEVRDLEEHFDLCPVCFDALLRLRNAQSEATDPERLRSNWAKAEADIDATVYSYLNALPSSKSQKRTAETGAGLLLGLKAFIDNLRLPLPAYAGIAIAVLLVSLYSYAFLSRPANFTAAQIELPAITASRGTAATTELMKEGLADLSDRNFLMAIDKFTRYLQENSGNYSANFYLGVSYLASAKMRFLGMPYRFDGRRVQLAIDYLTKALDLAEENAYYKEDCLWYLGKASLMLGRVNEAQQHFRSLLALPQPDLTRKSQTEQMLQYISGSLQTP